MLNTVKTINERMLKLILMLLNRLTNGQKPKTNSAIKAGMIK